MAESKLIACHYVVGRYAAAVEPLLSPTHQPNDIVLTSTLVNSVTYFYTLGALAPAVSTFLTLSTLP